jgi:hypothetical protein
VRDDSIRNRIPIPLTPFAAAVHQAVAARG